MESLLANKPSKVNSLHDRLVGSGFWCSRELWEFEHAQHSIIQMGAMEHRRDTCSRVLAEVGLEPRYFSSGPEPGLALLTHMSSLLLAEITVFLISKVRGQQDCPVKGLMGIVGSVDHTILSPMLSFL